MIEMNTVLMSALDSAILSFNDALFVCVLLLVAWALRTRQLDVCSQTALLVWLVDDAITLVLTAVLYRAFEDPILNRTVFYLSLATLATLSMLLIAFVHYKTGAYKATAIPKLVSAALAMIVIITIIRYFDRVIFELDALELVYRYGVLSIKVCALPILLTYIKKYPRRFQLAN